MGQRVPLQPGEGNPGDADWFRGGAVQVEIN
jgi:hypothetical protein